MGPYAEDARGDITVEDFITQVYQNGNTVGMRRRPTWLCFDTPSSDMTYSHVQQSMRQSREYGNCLRGLIISSSHLLPHPCDISAISDDILKIRSALRRRNLQCFEVSEPLTEAQIAELDKGLEDCHSWILLSPKVSIDTELFKNEVIEQ